MSRILYPLAALAALGLAATVQAKTLPTSETSAAFSGHRFAHLASVTLAQARAIALKAQPGVITDEELERERGGSGLRYSFDVKAANGVTYEIGVDAKTGALLEHSKEGPNPD